MNGARYMEILQEKLELHMYIQYLDVMMLYATGQTLFTIFEQDQ